MTCIVGLVHGRDVLIGCDSASSGSSEIDIVKSPKVVSINDVVIGSAGDWLQLEVIEGVSLPKGASKLDRNGVIKSIVPAMRAAFVEAGLPDAKRSCHPILLGFGGQLFLIDTDYHVEESIRGYAAIGEGAGYAIGALYATRGQDPGVRIEIALEAAEQSCTTVRRPFRMFSTANAP